MVHGEPYVHEMQDGRVHIFVAPEDGKWTLSVLDHRTPFSDGAWLSGFESVGDAFVRGHEYVKQVEPGHDCRARGCHEGFKL